ncbi:hypothetical protein [Nocardia sp. NPDC050710]|uniref:hypothetical protein n=1 Tax=Nocardia sp. NPDC050710 TaxID=3157220 RepID=UPI0033DA534B
MFEMDGWLIQVAAGGDTLRAERQTRELYAELDTAEGLTAGFVDNNGTRAAGNHKGGATGDLVLWASVAAPTAAAGARVLVTLIKEWCARDRHRRVELTYNGNKATIVGRPDNQLQHIIDLFTMDAAGDPTAPDDPTSDRKAGGK